MLSEGKLFIDYNSKIFKTVLLPRRRSRIWRLWYKVLLTNGKCRFLPALNTSISSSEPIHPDKPKSDVTLCTASVHHKTFECPITDQDKLCGSRIWRVPLTHRKTDGHFVGIVLRRRPQCELRFDAVEHDQRRRLVTFVTTFDIDRPPTCSCLYFATYVREKSTLDP